MGVYEIKAVAVAGIKKLLKYTAWFIAICVAIALYGIVSRWMENRADKKAHTEEFFRRNNMTSEARLAEDAAKAKAAEEKRDLEKRVKITTLGKQACLSYWMRSLRDPDSGVLEGYEHAIDEAGRYNAEIHGRAKNGFGGYVRSNHVCEVEVIGDTASVTFFRETKY